LASDADARHAAKTVCGHRRTVKLLIEAPTPGFN